MRIIAACALVLIIALLCVYSGLYHPGVTIDACLADPARHDGAIVYSPHESTAGAVSNGGFIMRWDHREISVRGTIPDLSPGEYVGVKGIFRKEGYIEALSVHSGRYRRAKMLVSIFGPVIVVYLLWKKFRWDSAKRGFEERSPEDL
jgi:hypothetical protein